MTKYLDEKQFQRFIVGQLVERNGFVERKFKKDGDENWMPEFAIDRGMLMSFLWDSQPETMEALQKIFKDKFERKLLACINAAITGEGGLLYALKHPVEIANHKLTLLYRKPEHPKVIEQKKLYEKNLFTVAQEVWASDKERVDLVIFVNGIAVISFELKCNISGQGYLDAIKQYKQDRNPKTRLFMPGAGCLVDFAMDLEEVYMTTRLAEENTSFLPFNRGKGKGINAGKGNSPIPGKYAVSYMWERILTKDTIVELIMKFMFVDGEGRVIFPRYHQLDCIQKLLADVRDNDTAANYLIEHSAGSGKTNTIAWLAHRLSSLHNEDGESIDDNVIIITDRVVVDRQLQQAVTSIEHKTGLVKVMDEDCTSADLVKALNGNTKIIATTIQKFPYVIEKVKDLKDKHFGVIIDEAHSSTAGKDMMAVTKVLGGKLDEDADADAIVQATLKRHGKQKNVSMFAFTATPKPATLELFGTPNDDGKKEAFHLYSMKQAIEEGFILDVLQNFTSYESHYEIVKKIEDDPFYKQRRAKSIITRYALEHDLNVAQRVEIIVEHFRGKIAAELGGEAKAMLVCGSRKEAVKYQLALTKYLREHGLYDKMRSLVAFSGTVKHEGKELSEAGMNGIPEKKLPDAFKKPENRFLVVANKYQTGFDQPKLCAMYVMKSLSGIAAVQTLSRLNRICKPFDKHTFILDFVNTIEDVKKAFAPYYTTTILASSVTPRKLYLKLQEVEKYGVVDEDDVREVWEKLVAIQKLRAKLGEKANHRVEVVQQEITYVLDQAKIRFDKLDDDDKSAFLSAARTFVKWYGFIVQVSQLDDAELYKKYRYVDLLAVHLAEALEFEPINLKDKIDARDFSQELIAETLEPKVEPKPEVRHSEDKKQTKSEDLEARLSAIIEDINARHGTHFTPAAVSKNILQIQELLLQSAKLAVAAKANDLKSFRIPFYNAGKDVIVDSYEQNQDFYQLLLDNDTAAKSVLDAILKNVYHALKK